MVLCRVEGTEYASCGANERLRTHFICRQLKWNINLKTPSSYRGDDRTSQNIDPAIPLSLMYLVFKEMMFGVSYETSSFLEESYE